MKKLLAILAAALIAAAPVFGATPTKKSSSKKQPQKEYKFHVGGTVGLSLTNYNDETGVSVKILPEFSYQINKTVAVGAIVGWSRGYAAMGTSNVNDAKSMISTLLGAASDMLMTDGDAINGLRFAPYVRCNIVKGKRVALFADGLLGLSYINVKSGASMASYVSGNIFGFEMAVQPGISVYLDKGFSLVAKAGSFGYQLFHRSEEGYSENAHRFGFDIDPTNIVFGLTFGF